MEEIHKKIVVHKENHHTDNDDPFNFPPGVRFCPHDEELIRCYLQRKVMNQILPPNKIPDVNLYKYSPDDLSAMYPPIGEKEWYFFTPRDKKYPNGSRPNRAAGNGFWKATGADKPIHDQDKVVVGLRKALVYYEGKAPKGDKTNWIMHEYKVNESPPPKSRAKGGDGDDMRLDDWVLCRIYNKVEKYAPKNELVKSGQAASPSPSPPPLPPYDETEYSLYHHHGMENLLNPDLVGSFMYDNPLCDLEYVMSCPLQTGDRDGSMNKYELV